MSLEVELKLLLPPSAQERLREQSLLQGLAAERFELINIYCDTPEQTLTQSGMALRLRNKGTQWLQTLKTQGQVEGGLHRRMEWEMPVAGPALEWSELPADVLPSDLNRASVSPIFETRFARSLWVLTVDDSVIELVLDTGSVSTGAAELPLSEIELELKSGSPKALFRVAEQLAAHLPVLPSDINKAERGYRLVNGATDWPVTPNKEAPLSAWTAALCRQCEALPASRGDLTHTLHGLMERGDIHPGLWRGLHDALQTDTEHWGELPGIQRLGQWLVHQSAVQWQEAATEGVKQ
ncbi:CYTH domain-containing protein [Salinispirillum marinum]|uniref:CYTH domain-containing protein n=2 Tax=Saccharospirillaceae TaxID=255527 RepID=A0ABV8BGV3_9GAMM